MSIVIAVINRIEISHNYLHQKGVCVKRRSAGMQECRIEYV